MLIWRVSFSLLGFDRANNVEKSCLFHFRQRQRRQRKFPRGFDRHLHPRPSLVRAHGLDIVDEFESTQDHTEHHVLAIEPRSFHRIYEELGTVRVRSLVRHGNQVKFIVRYLMTEDDNQSINREGWLIIFPFEYIYIYIYIHMYRAQESNHVQANNIKSDS